MAHKYPEIDWSKIKDSRFLNLRMENNEEFPDDTLVAITGYLKVLNGNDKEPPRCRLYTSLDLEEYVEFAQGAVKIIVPEDGPSDADTRLLVPITVWLSVSVPLTRVQRVANTQADVVQRQENFLAGDIVNTYLPDAVAGGLPSVKSRAGKGDTIAPPCSIGGCGSTAPGCPYYPQTNQTCPPPNGPCAPA